MDIREPFFVKSRTDFSLYAMYDRTNWRLEASIRNPFTKYAVSEQWMSYPCIDMSRKDYDISGGRSIAVKVVWNFDYGKKTEQGEPLSPEHSLNSAILKSY